MPEVIGIEIEVPIDVAARRMRKLLAKGRSVMLWGLPGIGKSAIVHQLAALLSEVADIKAKLKGKPMKVIDFRTNIREPVDVRGVPVPDHATGTTKWFVPDELPQVERDGEVGILFIDEINTGTLQMMAVMLGLVLERRVGDYVLPSGWMIVAAGNRVKDRAAAQRMPTALRNRFAHIFIKPDVDAWCKWARANGIAPVVIAFIRLRRELLHRMPQGDENTFPSPRSIAAASLYVDEDVEDRQALFAAEIGNDVAGELEGFIELYNSLGNLDDAIANPTTAKLPGNASEAYAICTGLARMADRKNFGNIVTYAERLPQRDHQLLVVELATAREPGLKLTAGYGAWAIKNADLTVQ